jgi:hypothetical protein
MAEGYPHRNRRREHVPDRRRKDSLWLCVDELRRATHHSRQRPRIFFRNATGELDARVCGYLCGYIALINAVGKGLFVKGIFTEDSTRRAVKLAFELLRKSGPADVMRILEVTIISHARRALVLGLYLFVGTRSRLRRLPLVEDPTAINVFLKLAN